MKRYPILTVGLVSIFSVIALLVGARYVIRKMLEDSLRSVTDINQYESLLADWSATGLTGHFPSSIPPRAKKARLSAFPGFLQGGAHFQLYTLVPAEDAAAADAKFSSAATHKFHGGNFVVVGDQPSSVPTIFFYTSGTNNLEFDSSFSIYVLSANPAQVEGEGDSLWNHGECCGVAVSTQRHEVVYWAEAW